MAVEILSMHLSRMHFSGQSIMIARLENFQVWVASFTSDKLSSNTRGFVVLSLKGDLDEIEAYLANDFCSVLETRYGFPVRLEGDRFIFDYNHGAYDSDGVWVE